MWLLKLPLKIIALPVMAVVAVLSIFYSIALHLSSLVVGLGYLFLGVCIVVLLFQQCGCWQRSFLALPSLFFWQ